MKEIDIALSRNFAEEALEDVERRRKLDKLMSDENYVENFSKFRQKDHADTTVDNCALAICQFALVCVALAFSGNFYTAVGLAFFAAILWYIRNIMRVMKQDRQRSDIVSIQSEHKENLDRRFGRFGAERKKKQNARN